MFGNSKSKSISESVKTATDILKDKPVYQPPVRTPGKRFDASRPKPRPSE